MPRIKPVSNENASEEIKALFTSVKQKLGMVPNLITTLAHSTAAANAYLALNQTLSNGQLNTTMREKIALIVGETNNCQYCVSAHTAGGKAVGLSHTETVAARMGKSENPKEQAGLVFAQKVTLNRGVINDDELSQVRLAGYTDGEIAEIVAHVAMNIFTNYFNHIADTEIDFPMADLLTR